MTLTKKDYLCIDLFFLLMLAITPIMFLVDETPIEAVLPAPLALLGTLGGFLCMPIIFVMHSLNMSTANGGNLTAVSLAAAFLYSIIFAFILSKVNERNT